MMAGRFTQLQRIGQLGTAVLLIAAVLAACSSAPKTSSRSSTARQRSTPPDARAAIGLAGCAR